MLVKDTKNKMEIKKVKKRSDGTKIVIVPRNSNILEGDYVKIVKIEDSDKEAIN